VIVPTSNDIRGSVRLVFDTTTGTVVQRTDYSPFGIATGTAAVQPFGFDGGLVGADGAVRFGARDYDPTTGRWRSKDPTGFSAGTPDLYGFVVGNPVNRHDSDGRAPRAPAPNASGADEIDRGGKAKAKDACGRNCKAKDNLDEVADKFISRCRKGSIRRKFPREFLGYTLGEINECRTRKCKTAWKLLNDNRFKK